MASSPSSLYHLVPAAAWAACKAESRPYYPATYEQDGFTHLTAVPGLLLEVANHFYVGEKGAWLCLKLAPGLLCSEVKFEPAAPVGDRSARGLAEQEEEPPLFPHLYGPIDFAAVEAELEVVRDENGAFLSITGL